MGLFQCFFLPFEILVQICKKLFDYLALEETGFCIWKCCDTLYVCQIKKRKEKKRNKTVSITINTTRNGL